MSKRVPKYGILYFFQCCHLIYMISLSRRRRLWYLTFHPKSHVWQNVNWVTTWKLLFSGRSGGARGGGVGGGWRKWYLVGGLAHFWLVGEGLPLPPCRENPASSIWLVGWTWSDMAENDKSTSKWSVKYQEDKIWSPFPCILVLINRESYELSITCSSLTPSVSQFNIFLKRHWLILSDYFHEVNLFYDFRTNRA